MSRVVNKLNHCNQPTWYQLASLVCLCSRFSRGRKQTDERRKILETRSTTHMLKDLPERNTLLAGSQQQTNNYSQEIVHDQNTFERRIYGMTIRQIFHRSFNEQRKPFRKTSLHYKNRITFVRVDGVYAKFSPWRPRLPDTFPLTFDSFLAFKFLSVCDAENDSSLDTPLDL